MQRCPECDGTIKSADMNISEGVALCPKCGALTRLSDLIESYQSTQEILNQPPAGCTVESYGNETKVSASLRSISGFLTFGAFALFWNAIVSVFVLIALAGLYTNLIGPIPEWFPAPEMEGGKPEVNGEPMGLGMTLFLCVFLIPFVTAGAGMAIATLMNVFGRVEVVVNELNAHVGIGIWRFMWRRRFDPQQVKSVKFGTTRSRSEEGTGKLIEMKADRTVQFGSMLQPERMEWMQAVLKELLVKKSKAKIFNSAIIGSH